MSQTTSAKCILFTITLYDQVQLILGIDGKANQLIFTIIHQEWMVLLHNMACFYVISSYDGDQITGTTFL